MGQIALLVIVVTAAAGNLSAKHGVPAWKLITACLLVIAAVEGYRRWRFAAQSQ